MVTFTSQPHAPASRFCRFHCAYVWVAIFLVFVVSASAFAQSSNEESAQDPPGYREAISRGIQEFGLGNYEEARAEFARANTLFPNARALRGMGVSDFELKNYVESFRLLEQALASDVKRLDGKLRKETAALLDRVHNYVGELDISVAPLSTAVLIDGTRRVSILPAQVPLAIGEHVIEFRAAGFVTERRTVRVHGRQREQVSMVLTPLGTGEEKSSAPHAPTTDLGAIKTPIYKRWWLWTTVGVVVAGAAVGTVIALRAKDEHDGKIEPIPGQNTPPGVVLQPLWSH